MKIKFKRFNVIFPNVSQLFDLNAYLKSELMFTPVRLYMKHVSNFPPESRGTV